MAKQRGIHQISGKINNLCYYEQKYVRGGLIRRINDAMSERLKTDPVFANTRRANKIFGGCSIVAKTLLDFFGNRNTFLFKPYRHALLTRGVQKYFIPDDSVEGYPTIFSSLLCYNYLSQVIDSIVKNSIFDWFNELDRQSYASGFDEEKTFRFSYESLVRYCENNKCIGVQLSLTRAYHMYGVSYDPTIEGYPVPENNIGGRVTYYNWYLNVEESDLELTTTTGTIDDAGLFWIIYASPILREQQGRPVTGQTGACCGVSTLLITL